MACLAMVLACFGRRGGLVQCRALCDPGRDGLTAIQLADAARALGLSVDAWVVDSGRALLDPRYGLPAIAHWRGAHFVVIERVSRRGFTIVDPAVGRRRITMRAFDEEYSGTVLTFARGSMCASWAVPVESWWSRFIRRFVHTPDVGRLGTLLLFSTLALLACGLVLPLLTRQIVDDVEADWLGSPAAWLAAAGALVVTSQGLLGYLRGRAAMQLQACFECQLTGHLVSHLLRLPVRFFQQRPAAPLLLRAGGPGLLRDQTTQAVLVGLDGLFLAAYLALIALWSPPFAVLVSTAVGLQIALLALSRLAMGGVAEGEIAARADAENLLADVLRGMASVKAAGAEGYVLERWKQAFARQEVLSDRCQARGAVFDVLLTHLRLGATIALLGLGAREVLAGRLTVGEMLALVAMAGAVLTPFCSLSGGVRPLHLARVQLARVLDLFEVPSQQALAPRALRRRLSGSIRVERLAFRYNRSGPFVLDDVSFAASAGATIAIVGRSGSGKSTLAQLLAGLHEPTGGRVSIDGWSLTTFDGARMRQQCGVVLQGSVPFNLTIRENIAFGRPELTLADVVRAAKVAGLHDEIEQMPMGYDTCVLEGGAGLSSGQRQRLLIARAIAHRPALLILDDGLSQVDEELGRRVAMRLRGLVCTKVIVAHRIAETRDADLVLLLEQGRLIEQGSPEALLAAGGRYASLAATELAVAGGGYELERTTCQSISEMSAGIRD